VRIGSGEGQTGAVGVVPVTDATTPCACSRIVLGSERTAVKNWNPDCLEHGTESEWYRSEAQAMKRQANSTRLRAMQTIARLRRQDRITSEDAKILTEALSGSGRWPR